MRRPVRKHVASMAWSDDTGARVQVKTALFVEAAVAPQVHLPRHELQRIEKW